MGLKPYGDQLTEETEQVKKQAAALQGSVRCHSVLCDEVQVVKMEHGLSGLQPFAVVRQVVRDSPAYGAGIRRLHQIIEFGPFHINNHSRLCALHDYVCRHGDQPIDIKVLEPNGNVLNVTVVPRMVPGIRWSIGCLLVPL